MSTAPHAATTSLSGRAPSLGPAPVLGFLLVHMALRADVAALAADVSQAPRSHVMRRARLLERVVFAHHTGEDEVLLPALGARVEGFAPIADTVTAQHEDLDAALAELRSRAGAIGARRDLAAAVTDVQVVLEEHLATEERELLPLWLSSFGDADHDAFGRRLRRATPARDLAVMVPWLLDATPAHMRAEAWKEVPVPIRAAYRLWWRRWFTRRFGAREAGLALAA